MDIKGAVLAVEVLHQAMTPDEQAEFAQEMTNRYGRAVKTAGELLHKPLLKYL